MESVNESTRDLPNAVILEDPVSKSKSGENAHQNTTPQGRDLDTVKTCPCERLMSALAWFHTNSSDDTENVDNDSHKSAPKKEKEPPVKDGTTLHLLDPFDMPVNLWTPTNAEFSIQSIREAIDRNGTIYEFQSILDMCPSQVKSGESLASLVEYALQHHAETKIVKSLVDCDTNCSHIRNETFQTLLIHVACRYNASFETIQRLLDLNPDAIRERDGTGMLPLHIACSNGATRIDTIKLLVNLFPESIALQAAVETYPLHLAIDVHASLEVVTYLWQREPSVARKRDSIGRLPIHCASVGALSPWNVGVVTILLDTYPESLQVADNFGSIPLHDVVQSITRIVDNEFHEHATFTILNLLLSRYPGGVRRRDYRGLLPLHIACMRNIETRGRYGNNNDQRENLIRIRQLIAVDPYTVLAKSNYGYTPLELAYQNGRSDAFKALLMQKQREAIQAIHGAVEELPLPDLVIAEIWEFAKPVVNFARHDFRSHQPARGSRWQNTARRREQRLAAN